MTRHTEYAYTLADKTERMLDDEDLNTILTIARNEQIGRLTQFEVRHLVAVYRAFFTLSSPAETK